MFSIKSKYKKTKQENEDRYNKEIRELYGSFKYGKRKLWYIYLIIKYRNNHCLKVFGLFALNILLYLLLLALATLLMMGNLNPFCLNKWLFDLLILSFSFNTAVLIIEIVSWEALWFPAISMCSWLTAPFSETSRYYLYMLWILVLDWYLNTIPKVFTWLGLRS